MEENEFPVDTWLDAWESECEQVPVTPEEFANQQLGDCPYTLVKLLISRADARGRADAAARPLSKLQYSPPR